MSEQSAARKLNRSNLRRLIRGRAYTSIAQIRRYFTIESDEMTPLAGPAGNVYVALPERAAEMLGKLWLERKIDIHLSQDVRAPLVEGVYPIEAPVRLD